MFKSTLTIAGVFFSRVFPLLLFFKLIVSDLTPEDFGLISQYMSFLVIIYTLTVWGGGNFLIKSFSFSEDKSIVMRKSYGVLVLSFCTVFFILISFQGWIDSVVFKTQKSIYFYIYLVFSYALASFSTVYSSYHASLRTTKYIAYSNIAGSAAYVCMLYLAYKSYGIDGLYFVLPIYYAAPAFFQIPFVFLKKNNRFLVMPKFDFAFSVGVAKYSASVLAGVVAVPFISIIIRHDFESIYGGGELGYWQAAVKISDALQQFAGMVLAYLVLPMFSNNKKIIRLRNIVSSSVVCVVLAIFLILYFHDLLKYIVLVLFGENYLNSANYLTWYACGDVFRVFSLVFVYYLISKSDWISVVIYELAQGGIYYLLFQHFIYAGEIYAAKSYAITYLVTAILILVYCSVSARFRPPVMEN